MVINIRNQKNKVVLRGRTIRERVVMRNCVNCTVTNCKVDCSKIKGKVFTMTDCVNCKVLGTDFYNKKSDGGMLMLLGAKTRGNIIERCTFRNHTYKSNNAEPLRLGNSSFSGCNYNTVVRYCRFLNNRSDPETISIKSCGNVITNNLHQNNLSSFVVRHGGLNKINNNLFRGNGGIRLHGAGNEVRNNVFEKNNSSSFRPIRVVNGNVERDPNFSSVTKPRGRSGKSHASYARVVSNRIENNVFDNCNTICIQWGEASRKFKPTKVRVANNTILSRGTMLKFSRGAKASGNTFSSNRRYGSAAKAGDISAQVLKSKPSIPKIKVS